MKFESEKEMEDEIINYLSEFVSSGMPEPTLYGEKIFGVARQQKICSQSIPDVLVFYADPTGKKEEKYYSLKLEIIEIKNTIFKYQDFFQVMRYKETLNYVVPKEDIVTRIICPGVDESDDQALSIIGNVPGFNVTTLKITRSGLEFDTLLNSSEVDAEEVYKNIGNFLEKVRYGFESFREQFRREFENVETF